MQNCTIFCTQKKIWVGASSRPTIVGPSLVSSSRYICYVVKISVLINYRLLLFCICSLKGICTQIYGRKFWCLTLSINPSDLKAPGPDGLQASFYQGCWEVGRESVINHINIALTTNVKKLETVSNCRPIGLCKVSYKIITKVIIKRLKPLLDHCISMNQGAFAPSLSSQDNVLIAHEIFSGFKGQKIKKN